MLCERLNCLISVFQPLPTPSALLLSHLCLLLYLHISCVFFKDYPDMLWNVYFCKLASLCLICSDLKILVESRAVLFWPFPGSSVVLCPFAYAAKKRYPRVLFHAPQIICVEEDRVVVKGLTLATLSFRFSFPDSSYLSPVPLGPVLLRENACIHKPPLIMLTTSLYF